MKTGDINVLISHKSNKDNFNQRSNKMTFLKNKPFHFMLALIFTCATTKAIHADSIGVLKTPSQENSEVVVLGDKDFLYLERKEGVWHLMSCEGSSLCGEVDMNDIEVDKIASYLIDSDLESHIKDYCTPEKEDYLCELFASSLELAQRKTDRNWAGAGAGAWAWAGAVAVAVAVALALAWGFGWGFGLGWALGCGCGWGLGWGFGWNYIWD